MAVSEEPPYFTYERSFEEHQKDAVFYNAFSVEIEFRETVGQKVSAYRGPRWIYGVEGKSREFRAEQLKCKIEPGEVEEIKKTLTALEIQRLPEKPDFSKQLRWPWGLACYGLDAIRGFAVSPKEELPTLIDDTVEDIVKKISQQPGRKWEPLVRTCVGDDQPVQKVGLGELVADPRKFHAKRIRVTGYYALEFEDCALWPDAGAHDIRESVWVGGISAFADKKEINPAAVKGKRIVIIDGTFDADQNGHMGAWPGSIERITRVVPAGAKTETGK